MKIGPKNISIHFNILPVIVEKIVTLKEIRYTCIVIITILTIPLFSLKLRSKDEVLHFFQKDPLLLLECLLLPTSSYSEPLLGQRSAIFN